MLECELEDKYMVRDVLLPVSFPFAESIEEPSPLAQESQSSDPEDALGEKQDDKHDPEAQIEALPELAEEKFNSMAVLQPYESDEEGVLRTEGAAQKERLGEMLNGATNALKSQGPDGKTQTDEVDRAAAVVAALSFAMFFDTDRSDSSAVGQVVRPETRRGRSAARTRGRRDEEPRRAPEQKNKLELESQRLEGLMHELSSSGLGLSNKRSMRNEL
ncbi:hypothetical protein B0H14DRAFT_3880265 [Mycena olivaceomarginata]|nr:hypothetical protein B0H14DRAFT_3880265 [Mycena olivaceomarginata]